MTGPGFPVDDPGLRRWMGDVEPAWASLAFESFNALRHEPSATNRALSLASALTLDELNASAVARNALLLVRHASTGSGLKLTETGNLARSVVAEMIDLCDWRRVAVAGGVSLGKAPTDSMTPTMKLAHHFYCLGKGW